MHSKEIRVVEVEKPLTKRVLSSFIELAIAVEACTEDEIHKCGDAFERIRITVKLIDQGIPFRKAVNQLMLERNFQAEVAETKNEDKLRLKEKKKIAENTLRLQIQKTIYERIAKMEIGAILTQLQSSQLSKDTRTNSQEEPEKLITMVFLVRKGTTTANKVADVFKVRK